MTIQQLSGVYNHGQVHPEGVYSKQWWVYAPWAHPLWHSYLIGLADLVTPTKKTPKIYMQGATHEVQVFALHPDQNEGYPWPPVPLIPANHIYQFKAENNEMAELRIEGVIAAIKQQRLSPDTDFVRVWDGVFSDGVSLRQ